MTGQKYFSPPMNQADVEEKKRRDRVVAIVGLALSAVAVPMILAAIFASLGLLVMAFRWFTSLLGA